MVRVTALPTDRVREIESFVTDWMSAARIPGASVAVVDGDDLVFAAGFGARDLASNAPATPETLYGVASVTKSFTALAILQHVESGAVALEDEIAEYVDVFGELDDPPTVADLLTHTSGMPSDASSVALILRGIDAASVEVPLSSDADFRRYVDGSTDFRSGDDDRFHYYNAGYELLGRLVETVDGRDFATYVDDEILAPIGMHRSTLDASGMDEMDDVMTPYRKEEDESTETPYPDKGVGAAGGLLSPVTDLASYLRFQFDPDPAVIDPSLLGTAHRAHARRQTALDGTEQHYGYGWMRRDFLGDTLVEHGGSLGVSASFVGFLESAELGVAIGVNTTPDVHPVSAGTAIMAILRDEEPADVVGHYGLTRKFEQVTGEYESYRGIVTASVEQAGGSLEITLTFPNEEASMTAQPRTLDPDDLTFDVVTADGTLAPLEFEETTDGVDLYFRRWHLVSA